jgi:hypothetical protein
VNPNIQQPTSNAQHPIIASLAAIGCWMFQQDPKDQQALLDKLTSPTK